MKSLFWASPSWQFLLYFNPPLGSPLSVFSEKAGSFSALLSLHDCTHPLETWLSGTIERNVSLGILGTVSTQLLTARRPSPLFLQWGLEGSSWSCALMPTPGLLHVQVVGYGRGAESQLTTVSDLLQAACYHSLFRIFESCSLILFRLYNLLL